ncbi:hypothetical protein Z052_18210 [Halorubrum sp. C191]|uniref:polysaccharide deacetylase family protein n=1 Tax=Halorubrum sp. C191 TaxID=1383842 RepID=UPI000C081DFE|nr:hypothetical protein Z052_18210 [Halorubrum sp. C191]
MSNNTRGQGVDSAHKFEWPSSPVIYLTVDYECDYGTALTENSYGALEETPWLASLIEELEIPLTCFVQTRVFDERPEQVEQLRSASSPVTFHPHSHSHRPRDETDIGNEISKATAAYEDFFGRSPVGYRFPNGNVRSTDYELLAENGYKFDASVFPSWRPGHFDNTNAPTRPQFFTDYDLLEIPFTVYSDRIRIPTALSYCRLLGRPFTELLARRPPPVVIFNIHMHDLVNPPAFNELSPLYRGIYSRNPDGKSLLTRVLKRLQRRGYEFRQLDDLHESFRKYEAKS